MNPDLQRERQQAHALLDLPPLAKLGAVRTLLEVMVDEEDEEELAIPLKSMADFEALFLPYDRGYWLNALCGPRRPAPTSAPLTARPLCFY